MTLLPELSVAVENLRGQLAIRPFERPVPTRTLALVWRPSAPHGEAYRALAVVLRSALARAARAEACGP